MPKKKEFLKEHQKFTCSNSACGWVFSKPIKVMNLRESSSKPYDACPRCLTQVIIELEPAVETKTAPETESVKVTAKLPSESKRTEPQPAGPCAHHFGYLSERPKNEKISDECVMCENIVKCMLKKMDD
jgi:hypothetical protein